ncbi:MAG: copper homeostasis protein CutC [Planctomycetes bacterium]|nr:copper homeostasis protein CutC [Planctomycetota bacterium]
MPAAANAPVLVEVAVDSVAGARAAVAAGAQRLELCAALELGGLTPSVGLLAEVRAAVNTPVFAMVRPRSGDFLYDDGEFAAMLRDIATLRAGGAAGIVSGTLRADGSLDAARMRELKLAAGTAPFTCHRCFDVCANAATALETLVELGVPRVLTSGQAASAPAGAAVIRAFVQQARDRLIVMAGAGVRAENVRELVAMSGVREVHLSATNWRPSGMAYRRAAVPMGAAIAVDEYVVRETDGEMVARVVRAVSR